MKAFSHQLSAFSKKVGTQNETRENKMFVNNEEMVVGAVSTAMIETGRIAAKAAPTASRAWTIVTVLAAALFAPQISLAQNECGLQTDPGNPETVTCPGGTTYNNGITYDALGDLTLVVPASPSGNLILETEGVNATATGSDRLFWDSSAFASDVRGQGGIDAVLDFRSDTGGITIDTQTSASVSGSADIGIRAHSGLDTPAIGDGGDIAISTWRIFANDTAIEAITDGGDISIAAGLDDTFIGDDIYAETSGTGTIAIDLAGQIRAGIQAVSDADISIDANNVFNSSGVGILTDTEGTATLSVGRLGVSGEVAIRGLGNRVVLTVTGNPAAGGNFHDFSGLSGGGVDFTGLSGGAEINLAGHGSEWEVDQDDLGGFSPSDDVVNIAAGALLRMSYQNPQSQSTIDHSPATTDFGDGADRLHNAGMLWVGPYDNSNTAQNAQLKRIASEWRFDNLETFENAGTVLLGPNIDGNLNGGGFRADGLLTDLWRDDILSMPGTHWVGLEGSLLVLDADLNAGPGVGQNACNASLRQQDPDRFFRHPGDLPAADCVDLTGGAASGRTLVQINQLVLGDRGAYNPEGFVIIDLAGADLADIDPDAFAVAPSSAQYSPVAGGVVDKGVFVYSIGFDAETQQFKLFGVPGSAAQQLPLMGHVANGLWHTAASAWFDRRVDQRDLGLDAGLGGGVWIRAAAREGDRDVITPILAGTTLLNFDNSYTQDDSTVTFGLDLVSRSSGDMSLVFGGMIGYARSRVSFDASPNTANFEGVHGGLYGSATFGDFFVDAALNGNWVDMHADVPAMDLKPEGTLASSDVNSLGGQIEAGWRWRMNDRLTIEPLAGWSYVRSDFEELVAPADNPNRFGAVLSFDDKPVSNRGSLGVRGRLANVLPGFAPTSVGVTARVIEEFDGDADITVVNLGPLDAPMSDTFDGTFGQVTGDVSVTNAAKTAAGFLKVDAVTGDDYDSLGVSAGFRYQW